MNKICPKCQTEVDEDAPVCPKCRYILLGDDSADDEFMDPAEIYPEGTVLAENYRIVRTVGFGGAGVVYEARQIGLNNMPVAVKVLHPDLNEDDTTIGLLKKEVIIARELTHDAIMKVYSLERTENRYFIVMEYVDGESLQGMLERSEKLRAEKASEIFFQVAAALQYAHERGIIHLDIKPANILVGSGGQVKLCDFGIARMAFGTTTTATQRIITGSVGFMPPEQFRGRKYVSHRSDIYALGATLYNALTGEVPIGVIDVESVPPSVITALQRKPEDRFDSVTQFVDAYMNETGHRPQSVDLSRDTVITAFQAAPDAQPAEESPAQPTTRQEPPAPAQEKPAKDTADGPPAAARPTVRDEVDVRPDSPKEAPPPSPTSMENEKRGAPSWLYGVGVLALVIALVIVGLSVWRSDRKGAGAPKEASGPAVGETAARSVVLAPEGRTGSVPGPDEAKTVKPDEAVTEAVNTVLRTFVDSLNFDKTDQAYMILSPDLRKSVSLEKFRSEFFGSPRLWQITVADMGATPEGTVLVKLEGRMMDAYQGAVRSISARAEMTKDDIGWKISRMDIG